MQDRRDWIAILVIALLVLAVFWRALLGGVFYFGDIVRVHFPLRAEYAAELARPALPLWTPHLLAGYPLLAEGQLGALYPPNLVLHLLLPVPIAINVFVLSHLVWAAVGAYAFARRLQLQRAAACCAALVYGLGGFLVARLDQVNLLACAAWQPWLFLLADRLLAGNRPARPSRDAALLALAVGMQLLAGEPQTAVVGLLAVVAYGLCFWPAFRQRKLALLLPAAALLAGVALAGAQLLPTYELAQLSLRPSPDSFTALRPANLLSLLSPFASGNADAGAAAESAGYVGMLPLLLAVLAPFLVQSRRGEALRWATPARFFAVLAVVALVLAAGGSGPVYLALRRLPLGDFLRVPGRYLSLFAFSAAVLSGLSLDALLVRARKDAAAERGPRWLAVVIIALVAVAIAARIAQVSTWVGMWRWLPVALGLLALAWIVWARVSKGSSAANLGSVALALVLVDLIAFGAVWEVSRHQTSPLQEIITQPRSLRLMQSQTGVYRIYTQEKNVSSLSVLRESYLPNLSLAYGLSAGNGLVQLLPARYARYAADMTAQMLNLLGVKYYLIPQAVPADEASEAYDLNDPFLFNAMDKVMPTPLLVPAAVEMEWYLSQSADWPNSKPVAVLTFLTEETVDIMDFPLAVGSHVAEWAYDRSDVRAAVRHVQAPVARTFPARSGFPPEDHLGYVYRTVTEVPYTVLIHGLQLSSTAPPQQIHVERFTLIDAQGQRYLLSHLEGKGDHTLAYRSEDVAIFENHDVLPRVFLAYQARAVPDDTEALSILRSASFNPGVEVLLAGEELAATAQPTTGSERVELAVYDSRQVVVNVQAPAAGYLVLTDAWYPGWHVRVDGQEAPLLRADVIFRAVYLQAGAHTVEFAYDPASFRSGLALSAAGLLAVVGLWLWGRKATG